MTIKDLQNLKDIINIKNFCIISGINHRTIATKLSKNRELTVTESEAFEKTLADRELYHKNIQSMQVFIDLIKSQLEWK